MRTVLNVIWLVLSGFWLAIGYAFAGVLMCILIITIPFGLQAFKLARYSLWPLGASRTVRGPRAIAKRRSKSAPQPRPGGVQSACRRMARTIAREGASRRAVFRTATARGCVNCWPIRPAWRAARATDWLRGRRSAS